MGRISVLSDDVTIYINSLPQYILPTKDAIKKAFPFLLRAIGKRFILYTKLIW